MKLSYWEIKSWLTDIDFAIIGSGIVGLSCAIHLRELHPKAKIIVFERGQLPQGASTKNAGFACFGSVFRNTRRLEPSQERDVVDLAKQRIRGLSHLRTLTATTTSALNSGEAMNSFLNAISIRLICVLKNDGYVNALLSEVFPKKIFHKRKNTFGYIGIHDELIFNQYEGQIDTEKMMQHLLLLAQRKGVLILNSVTLESYEQIGHKVPTTIRRISDHLF